VRAAHVRRTFRHIQVLIRVFTGILRLFCPILGAILPHFRENCAYIRVLCGARYHAICARAHMRTISKGLLAVASHKKILVLMDR